MSRALSFPSTSLFTGFDELFSMPFPRTDVEDLMVPSPFLTSVAREADVVLRRSSPCYEITEDDNQFQLAVDVPGVAPNDIKVNLENGGRVLHVSGERKIERKGEKLESRFEKRFTLGNIVDASKVTANVNQGVLVVTCPKSEKHKEVRSIQVTELPHDKIEGK